MKRIRDMFRSMEPEDKKDLIENVISWGSLFAIGFMLSGICQ